MIPHGEGLGSYYSLFLKDYTCTCLFLTSKISKRANLPCKPHPFRCEGAWPALLCLLKSCPSVIFSLAELHSTQNMSLAPRDITLWNTKFVMSYDRLCVTYMTMSSLPSCIKIYNTLLLTSSITVSKCQVYREKQGTEG